MYYSIYKPHHEPNGFVRNYGSILDNTNKPMEGGRKSKAGFGAGLDQNKTANLQFQNMLRVPLVMILHFHLRDMDAK